MGEGAGMGEGACACAGAGAGIGTAIPLLLVVSLLIGGESVGGRYKGGIPGEGTG